MKAQSRWTLKVVGLVALLFVFDVGFDSFLVTNHQRYIFHDAWSHTPLVAIVCYVAVLGLIALGSAAGSGCRT